MTQISGASKKNLVFEIISARIQEEVNQKKYVIYNLQVRHISGNDDLSPSLIERRYSHFLNFFESLKNENPELTYFDFPKKVFLGNFDNNLISTRSTGFENLLKHVATHSNLRNSKSLIKFLQEPELLKVKELLKDKDYISALPILESLFMLLNKVFTDRSPAVLLSLCRLLGCSALVPGSNCKKWAELALRRYEGVSDSDLLILYVPVMQICIENGLHKEELERKLLELSKTGFIENKKYLLLDEVELLEKKLLNF